MLNAQFKDKCEKIHSENYHLIRHWEKEKCFSGVLWDLVIRTAEEQVTMSLFFCNRKRSNSKNSKK